MRFPAIVISAWKRYESLERLLNSLSKARFPQGEITLVFSIDGGGSEEAIQLAKAFSWELGPKVVKVQDRNLGLREHILSCGDLTKEYGAILLLEDDLIVSPYFFEYAVKALAFYKDDPVIGGISLYSHRFSESNYFYPFESIHDNFDNYFLQYAVSWGQMWTEAQWSAFREWYTANLDNPDLRAPDYMEPWGEETWKKYYTLYLQITNRYFVCPKYSLTSNQGDAGVHFLKQNPHYQVSLVAKPRNWTFSSSEISFNYFDAWFEPEPWVVLHLCPNLKALDFEVDLYGEKDIWALTKEWVLTTRDAEPAAQVFGMILRPVWRNIAVGVKGHEIKLVKASQVHPAGKLAQLKKYIEFHRYFGLKARRKSQVYYLILKFIGLF